MSRSTQSPPRSPFRSERREPLRSATAGSASSAKRTSILLSERQLSSITKNLAGIRHGSKPNVNTKYTEQEPSLFNSPASSAVLESPQPFESTEDPISSFSIEIQEYAIIEDLLFVLMGIDGVYIKINFPKSLEENDDPMEDVQFSVEPQDDWDNMKYSIDSTLDPSLRHLVEQILPIATYYLSIDAFIERFSRFPYGTVNHALCSAIRVFIEKYLTFIAQLEHEFQTSSGFTLQKLWFYAQDTLRNLKILHQLATCIRSVKKVVSDDEDDFEAVLEGLKKEDATEEQVPDNQKGGAVLNILSDRLVGLSGDPNCKKLYTFLLSKASVPYYNILNYWIYHGEIRDPYNEFMILEKKNVKKENLKEDFNDAYWEMRYTIREGFVPSFLEPMKVQILVAGKYLNVVRECGVNIAKPEEMQVENVEQNNDLNHPIRQEPSFIPARNEVWTAVDGNSFVKSLEITYKYANHTLLNLLLKDQQLMSRLRSLKHYFFLDQSDFLTSFLDLAKDELKQPASGIPHTRLQSLMDLVLRNPSSVAAYDPFKEDVKVSMSHVKLIDQLLRIINVEGIDASTRTGDSIFERSQSLSASFMSTSSTTTREVLSGYDALVLDYTVTFPLSLVISRKALTKYQLLFRFLLNLKHMEELLCGTWMDQKRIIWKTKSYDPELENWKFRIFSLRDRMLSFVQQFAYYVTIEVLEPNWRLLESNLGKVSTVDQVLQCHSDFLDTCLKECMLTSAKLLRIFNKLMLSCHSFAAHAEKFTSLLLQVEQEMAPDQFGLPKAGLGDSIISRFETTLKALAKMEETFMYHMKLLIDALNFYSASETVQFLCLVVRLDYNQYYNSNMPKRNK